MKTIRRFILEKVLFLSLAFLATIPMAYADTPQKGGDLKILVYLYPPHFNPAIQSGIQVMIPGAQLFATLVRFDEKWQPLPYLAKSWKISGDRLTYTFPLAEKATFHDGKPITSEDVAFSLEIMKKNHPFGISMLGVVERVETPDVHTAVVKLSKPHPALLQSLSLMPVIPKHVYGTEPIRNHPANLKPVGSGPFKFVEAKSGDYFIFERYDNFFRPSRPYLQRLIFKLVNDASAAEIAFRRGDVHYGSFSMGMRLQNITRLQKVDHLVITRRGYEGIGPVVYLEINLRKKPFSDLRVRQAIAYSIDQDFITQKLHQGFSVKSTGPLVHSNPFYSNDIQHYDLNLEKANKLLDEAGYPRKTDGTRFSATLDWSPGNYTDRQIIAEYLKPQLRKIGIDIQLRPPPDFGTWAKWISTWNYDLTVNSFFGYGDPVIGVDRIFLCENIKHILWSNTQGYCNPKVDEVLQKAAVEMDPEKRKSLYWEFQKLVARDLPLVFTHEPAFFTIYHRDLRNVPQGIWGAIDPLDQTYWKDGKEPQ